MRKDEQAYREKDSSKHRPRIQPIRALRMKADDNRVGSRRISRSRSDGASSREGGAQLGDRVSDLEGWTGDGV
jgi:hypothetical protein